MAKDRSFSLGGVWHSVEGCPQWLSDQSNNKRRSMASGFQWIRQSKGTPLPNPSEDAKRRKKKKPGEPGEEEDQEEVWDPEVSDLLSAESLLELFRSDVKALRPHPLDSWGYRIVRDLTEADGAKPGVLRDPSAKRGPGRPPKRDEITVLRDLAIGEPAIEHGTAAFVGVPCGDLSINPGAISEDIERHLPYVTALNAAAKILSTYDHLEYQWVEVKPKKGRKSRAKAKIPPEDEGQDESFSVVPGEKVDSEKPKMVQKIKVVKRKPRARGVSTNLRVKTVDVSPGLSRAVQLMIEAGRVDEARKILDELMGGLCRKFEEIFPGAKVVGAAWHVRSGQLHLDMWAHGTRLELVDVGLKEIPKTVRLWDTDVMRHFGPGPGVCAWNRHLQALGDEAHDLCPGIVDEVTRAKAKSEERGAEREKNGRGAGLANRDIAIHEAFDELVSAALPAEFVTQGMDVYREYLREFYTVGGDKKLKVQQFDEMGVSIAARLQAAKKAEVDAVTERAAAETAKKEALETLAAAEKARKEAESARDVAIREAAPILDAARKAEAALPAKEAAAELSGLQRAISKIFPDPNGSPTTVEEAEGVLALGVAGIRQEAELGAWSRVLRLLGKDEAGLTVETMAKDAETAIAGRITAGVAAGFAGFFKIFKRDVPAEARTPEELVDAVINVGESEKAEARRNGFAVAVSKIRNVEITDLEVLDEAGLQAEIETESAKFREAEAARDKAVVRLFAVRVFGGPLATSLIAKAKQSVSGMKDVLTREFLRRGKAEDVLERALPLLDRHDPKLAGKARRIIDGRPKLPVVPAIEVLGVAKKAAGKDSNGKPTGGDLPGSLG